MLELTPAAAARVREMAPGSTLDGVRHFLRIWRVDDDRSPSVRISFVEASGADDEVGITQGVPVCIDRRVASLLDGMVLDRRDSSGLFIRRAVATDRTCGDSRIAPPPA